MELDYYKDYTIETFESLLEKMDSNGLINHDIRITGDFVSLGRLKKINGHLNLSNDNLSDLGELRYIESDFWFHNEKSKLFSLGKLEEVGGSLLINGSNISDLGNLKKVNGKVNFRDTEITELNNLSYVGGDLYLPKRLEGLNLDGIEIVGKVRFWNDKKTSKIEELNKKFIENKSIPNFSAIHMKEMILEKRILTGKFLFTKCFKFSEYNKFTIDNYSEFISFIDSELENLYEERYSFYESLYGELKLTEEINEEFPKFKEKRRDDDFTYKLRNKTNSIIYRNKTKYPYKKYEDKLKEFKGHENWNKGISRYWVSYNEQKLGFCSNTGVKKGSFIYYVENKLLETFSVFVDSLQNKFRVSKGIPRIGEGWVSETDLYQKIKNYFSHLVVKHHGKPNWLGRQHVDIWIPKHKIGIEYQGEQHFRPVEFFGGEDAFLKNVERDENKKRLFELNEATLIEVKKGYSLEKLIKKIEKIIKEGGQH